LAFDKASSISIRITSQGSDRVHFTSMPMLVGLIKTAAPDLALPRTT
jgi:hypothetical protein